jgi:hypothetical protein
MEIEVGLSQEDILDVSAEFIEQMFLTVEG